MLREPAFRRAVAGMALSFGLLFGAAALFLAWARGRDHEDQVRGQMAGEAQVAAVGCALDPAGAPERIALAIRARVDLFDATSGALVTGHDPSGALVAFALSPLTDASRGADAAGTPVVFAASAPFSAPDGRSLRVRVSRPSGAVDAVLVSAQARHVLFASIAWLFTTSIASLALRSFWARAAMLRLALNEPKAIFPRDLDGVLGDIGRRTQSLLEESRAVQRDRSTIRTEADAILSSMTEGVIAVDRECRIRVVNDAAATLLGLGPDAARGQLIGGVVRFEGIAEAAMKAAAGEERTLRAEIPGPPPKVLDVHAEPVAQAGGAVLVLRDVTEEARYADMRRDFVAAASHELRTPIAVIRAAAETLLDGALQQPDQAKQFLDSVHRQAVSMEALIKDLLDLGKLESRPDLTLRPTDVADVLAKVVAAHGAEARKRRHAMSFDADEMLPRLIADASLLERAFSNVLENAVRYTPDGGKIAVRAKAEGGKVRVEIEDTGTGIPEKDLKRIFERFYRVDRSRSRELGGTGLGLAIVKHVVQLHKGEVWAESGPGRGAKFVVVLPGI